MQDAITTTTGATERWDDPLLATIRSVIRAAIEDASDAEFAAWLGAARYERVTERLGYRNGVQPRNRDTDPAPVQLGDCAGLSGRHVTKRWGVNVV